MARSRTLVLICAAAACAGIGFAALPLRAHSGTPRGVDSQRIATIDTLKLLRWSMQSAEMRAERDKLNEGISAQLTALQQQYMALQAQNEAMTAGDPQIQKNSEQMQLIGQQYGEVQQSSQEAADRLQAQQVQRVYELVIGKAEEFAKQYGYTHVVASPLENEAGSFDNTSLAMQALFARPMLVAPSEDDLTLRVASALKIEEPAPPAQPNTNPQPGETGPPGPQTGPSGPNPDSGGNPPPSGGGN